MNIPVRTLASRVRVATVGRLAGRRAPGSVIPWAVGGRPLSSEAMLARHHRGRGAVPIEDRARLRQLAERGERGRGRPVPRREIGARDAVEHEDHHRPGRHRRRGRGRRQHDRRIPEEHPPPLGRGGGRQLESADHGGGLVERDLDVDPAHPVAPLEVDGPQHLGFFPSRTSRTSASASPVPWSPTAVRRRPPRGRRSGQRITPGAWTASDRCGTPAKAAVGASVSRSVGGRRRRRARRAHRRGSQSASANASPSRTRPEKRRVRV